MNTVLHASGRLEFSAGKGQHSLSINRLKKEGAKWPDVQQRVKGFKEKDQEKIKAILTIFLEWN